MNPTLILAAILSVAVALAWVRIALWQRRAAPEARSPAWRLAVLVAAQPICALLLYLTLVPPPVRTPAGTLVVATRGADRLPLSAGEVVALPEAPASAVAERVPDLGTALRRHPDTQRLVVLGEGLRPRDLDAARGLAVSFDAATQPRGLVRLDPPPRVAPGTAFEVGGRVAGPRNGTVELLDPAGRVVDRGAPDREGAFVLRGTARAAGASLFALRLRDGSRVVEQAAVPVVATDDPAPQLLLLAGAPGPEPKFLRRWAADTGVTLHSRLSAGGGVELGDAPLAIDRATLARFDLAILDERSWAALGAGERAALVAAVRGGLGLVLRVTGPLPEAVRAQWRALGLAVSGGAEVAKVRLGHRPGELTRRTVRIDAPDDVPLLRDAAGSVVASWRAAGRGRVALWPVTDSYVLALAGSPNDHARLWSEAFAVLARPRSTAPPAIEPLPRAEQRMTICGLGADAGIVAPDGRTLRLVVEPPTRCAAFWPTRPGWHQLRDGRAGASGPWPFYVQASDALPGVRAAAARDATLRLVADRSRDQPSEAARQERGPSWPWLLAWLAASAALWWFERRPGSRPAS